MDFPVANHIYVAAILVLAIGLYGIVAKRNLMKKLIGLNIVQAAVIIIWVAGASRRGATVPVLEDPGHGSGLIVDAAAYINPLPHTLMLTAIVVGVATTGVAFALLITIYRRYGTLDEQDLLDEMRDGTP